MSSSHSKTPRYGDWKSIQDIELEDLLAHPIWLWSIQLGLPDEDDGPYGGDETAMRPLLGSDEVPLDHTMPPLILLRVEGTGLHAAGLYDSKQKTLESIEIYKGRVGRTPGAIPGLPEEFDYIAIPSIAGKQGIRFRPHDRESDEAEQVD